MSNFDNIDLIKRSILQSNNDFSNTFALILDKLGLWDVPSTFENSISWYQAVKYVLQYIINSVIPALQENQDDLNNLKDYYEEVVDFCNDFSNRITAFTNEKVQYMEDYMTNLDVQDEINVKLNSMYNTGALFLLMKPYFSSLEQRIDNLSHLQEGSTTGDAELQDIRVGYDGTQYDNAGTSVRSQIRNVHGVIDTITDTISPLNKLDITNHIEKNYNPNGTGDFINSTANYMSDYIHVTPSSIIRGFAKVASTGNMGRYPFVYIGEYDTTKEFIKLSEQYVGGTSEGYEISQNTEFIRIVWAKTLTNVMVTENLDPIENGSIVYHEYFDTYKIGRDDTARNQIQQIFSDISNLSKMRNIVKPINQSELGFLTSENINDCDYCYLPVYRTIFYSS